MAGIKAFAEEYIRNLQAVLAGVNPAEVVGVIELMR